MQSQSMIKRIILTLTVLSFSWNTSFSQGMKPIKSPLEFSREVDSVGLIFNLPSGYRAVPIRSSTELDYAFIIKNRSKKFEIRYIYWSLKEKVEEYRKCMLEDPMCGLMDPNRNYVSRMLDKVVMLAGGEEPIMNALPKPALKSEMNCDDGAFAAFSPVEEHADGYGFVQAIVLHKDNVADLVVFYYGTDKKQVEQLISPVFNALIFKP